MLNIPSDTCISGSITNRCSGFLQTLANPKPNQMAKLGTEIKGLLQNTQSSEYKLCSFDFASQELVIAAVYNSAEYCRFNEIDPDPLATEAGKFVLLGNSSEGTDAHSLLAKQFGISRTDSKTLGLSTLYSAGITSCCNLIRPTLGAKYSDKQLKEKVTEYHRYFKGTKARGDYLYTGGLFSHFFNYIQWLITQPVPRLQMGNQAITNTLRPEHCGSDYFCSRANWPVQGMGAAVLDLAGYEIDKGIFDSGLEDFIWYQFSVHDQLSYMCHESCTQEWAIITRKAYKAVWTKFFKSFRMTCPQQVFDNLELTCDAVDRKSIDTSLCTASGKVYFSNLANGIVL
jgi:DNA polymerase family A